MEMRLRKKYPQRNPRGAPAPPLVPTAEYPPQTPCKNSRFHRNAPGPLTAL